MTTGLLETDILTDELKEAVGVTVNQVWDVEFSTGYTYRDELVERGKFPSDAIDIYDFFDLVRRGINDYQSRAGIAVPERVRFTEEEPDEKATKDTITVSLVERLPGAFSKGPPGKAQHRVLTPRDMEEFPDTDNPGYNIRVSGMFYDNIVRFTCWARTNKKANERAMWFEKFMDEYMWWFRFLGTGRIVWNGQGTDIVHSVDEVKWYGRPIEYQVSTQRIKTWTQNSVREIVINMAVYTS